MEREAAQELIKKLDNIDKRLSRMAEALSVFKVMAIAFFIAGLIVIVKNFMP